MYPRMQEDSGPAAFLLNSPRRTDLPQDVGDNGGGYS
jgi:hypothetical protein